MSIVTSFPNVPISPSNVATDSARAENLQRPPILPPTQASKAHEERAFNPQHERAADQAQTQAKLRGSVQDKQQGGSQEGQTQQEHKKHSPASDVTALASYRAPLKRSDIKLLSPQQHQGATLSKALPDQTPSFYRTFGLHIAAFYNTQAQPKAEPQMLTVI